MYSVYPSPSIRNHERSLEIALKVLTVDARSITVDLVTSSTIANLRHSVLLVPSHLASLGTLPPTYQDSGEHQRLLAETQRLRGRIYLADGAVERHQLTESGRHVQAADQQSFHLLSLDQNARVVACTRYLPHANTVGFSRLGVARTPLTEDARWRPALERAVEGELARARKLGYTYVEMGGWAITEDLRCSTEAVRMVVTIYALARMLGGALGISTVTKRHASSSILRRLGGAALAAGTDEVTPYYDPHYGCEMEILRFDSDRPSEAYERAIQRCQKALARIPFLAPETADVRLPALSPLVAARA